MNERDHFLCPQCHRPIQLLPAAGGWVHSLSRSVWCGKDANGMLTGSCVEGPTG